LLPYVNFIMSKLIPGKLNFLKQRSAETRLY